MKPLAALVAGILLMQGLVASLPAWCVSGSCDEVIVDRSCCLAADGAPMADGKLAEDCQDCVEVDDTAPIVPDRTLDVGAVIAVVHRAPDLLDVAVVVEGAPRLPTGPPRPSAILRDLRTVRLLI